MSRHPLLLLALTACSEAPPPDAGSAAPEAQVEADLPEASEDPLGEIDVPSRDPVRARQLKRMTVAQIRDSMLRITGGVGWTEGSTSNWDRYADTLGVADYQLRVESDRSTSVMFQKFLDEAATETCERWVAGEGEAPFFPDGDPDPLIRADLVAQVATLRFLIQGRARTVVEPVNDDLVDLFTTVHQRTGDPAAAWQTVCVALFAHPDFFLY